MNSDVTVSAAGLEKLDPPRCYELLSSVPLGRIVFTEAALPAIQPVSFALDGPDVIIRTERGSKLAMAARSAVVAFEADSYDVDALTGWSVVIVGHAQAVSDPAERERLLELPLVPFAPGPRPHVIRIVPQVIRGRQILRPAPAS